MFSMPWITMPCSSFADETDRRGIFGIESFDTESGLFNDPMDDSMDLEGIRGISFFKDSDVWNSESSMPLSLDWEVLLLDGMESCHRVEFNSSSSSSYQSTGKVKVMICPDDNLS
jgi:hypothetical protein